MEPTADQEKVLVQQLRERIKDLSMPLELLADKNLIRWIRFKGHKLDDVEKMLRDHIRWRDEFNINVVAAMDNWLPPEYSNLFKLEVYDFKDDGGVIHIFYGNTVNLEKAVRLGLQTNVSQHLIGTIEKGWRLNIKHSEGKDYIPKYVSIYDMIGISTSQFSSKEAISFGIHLARTVDANYPECVKRVFVVNAPLLFQWVWKVLKAVLSKRTTERFVLLGFDKEEQRAELLKYLRPHQFPQRFGGDGDNEAKGVVELEEAYELAKNSQLNSY